MSFIIREAFLRWEEAFQLSTSKGTQGDYVRINGCAQFISSLVKHGYLESSKMKVLIEALIAFPTENHILALIGIWQILGPSMDSNNNPDVSSEDDLFFSWFCQKINHLYENYEDLGFCSRVKYLLLDSIELHRRKWLPRKSDATKRRFYRYSLTDTQ
eukprot:TRINITY_DN5377_c0_g1_i2.p1 TRINITY_DN5377_c0_g1~~TRINITY_DN5377_c0_g1_i2.p1  ORF type:complete len:158 (+),score=8.05 TRINITY_DN5377_c0_g1_i2:593-1066(+)